MIDTFRQLFRLLDDRERRRFLILMGLMVLVALAEVFGLSTVLILLNVLSEPDRIAASGLLSGLYRFLGFETEFGFLIFLSVAAFGFVLITQVIKAVGNYGMIRFAEWRGFSISCRLLASYLHQPYTWFLQNNSADISKTVLNEVTRLINLVMMPSLRILSNVIIALAVFAFLLALDPLITILSVSIMAGFYAATYLSLRTLMFRLGQRLVDTNLRRFKFVQEAAGGIKEIKLYELENSYVNQYSRPAMEFASANALTSILREIPRFIMEALVFAVLISAVLIVLIRNDGDIATAIPVLGTFGFAVLKLLPAMQQTYHGVASVRAGRPTLDNIVQNYDAERISLQAGRHVDGKLPIRKNLTLKSLGYTYPGVASPALRGLDLSIPACSSIGLVGGSGAGKSTVADLVLGLLSVQSGQILVDDTPVTQENLASWRRSIGYVPQSIYLTDSTVAENIAFGREPEAIDMAAVERAARMAALHDFVVSGLPEGYRTLVGERGVRLSGGQRQRIGIARALYHDPDLLILDEATSALDNLTEQAVMEAIHNIGQAKTIILIAHRLSTVAECDRIALLENGQVAALGTYDELLANSDSFRRLANVKQAS